MTSPIANIGGEEPEAASPPIAAHVAALFELLFPPSEASRITWPAALGSRLHEAAFSWLEGNAIHAWLNTDAALHAATKQHRDLAGASPEIVRLVHDKAFATTFARQNGYEARSLRGLGSDWDPDALRDPAAAENIHAEVSTWPAWTEQQFTLKPRFGGSGRGRFGGDSSTSPETIARALPRLAARGGIVLEPWVQRTADLSAQFWVSPDGTVTLLATLEQLVSASGIYRGHRGRLDHRHRITSGHRADAELLEAGVAMASAAHRQGFHGPCGVDAFLFQGPDGEELRPICEFNARFTLGTIVVGLLRRARAIISAELGPAPGSTLRFEFTLDGGPDFKGTPGLLQLPLAPGTGREAALLSITPSLDAPEE